MKRVLIELGANSMGDLKLVTEKVCPVASTLPEGSAHNIAGF
jgi:hypothetical protein